jgi:hypothetical protein
MSRFRVSLRIVHPTCDLSAFDLILGEHALRSWVAGSERSTPTGGKLDGINSNSYRAYSVHNESSSIGITDAIVSVTEKLESHQDRITEMLGAEGTMELFISVIDPDAPGDTLPWALLHRLGSLRVSLSLA